MAHVHSIDPARSLDRAMMDREHHRITLLQRHYFRPRLHARSLFGQDELTAGEILARLRQQHGNLQRKDMLSIYKS